ncbi:TAXI family TRAP transporter solute-binding subunit [Nocardiopsis sp. NRRL B-16309]|uniref:TAXI family TRAP transporter solute-binding subunit n=1 Tax=Nocardiopsis sp. NRRL B-16309 TaxID=1519494 RepID=UPI0006AFAFB2|nr:TAXI family TRAP transporter solute-binding subunit [Nocardiopsis sp. NRRL B-16309]KOX14046.1 C4-dicarboxylate ABC transporter substrate-binding protein [Nocardiopsis sp. NRRL B-16309]
MRVSGPGRRAVLLGAAAAALGGPVVGCDRGGIRGLPELVVATGPPGAVYRQIGGKIAEILDERFPDTDVRAVETGASHANLALLASGEAHLGLAALDSILASDTGGDGDALVAIGRLYDAFVHLVVLVGSPVWRASDLEGLRVSVGAADSGTEFTVAQIVAETGLDFEAVRLNQSESATALADGEIDAMFSLTGLPTPAIADLAEERSVRLIDLSDTADALADAHPDSYLPANIPATTYEDVPSTPTAAIPNLLLCREDLPRDAAYAVTDSVFTSAARLAAGSPVAAQINVRTGISTGVVPLHPGATAWYRENKPT